MKILFSMVSVVTYETEQIELLVKSARKHFLINHEVEFVVFTDVINVQKIDGITNIYIDNTFSKNKSYYQFQKILSLNYVDLDKYDYVFVHDIDQVYVGKVDDCDLLTNDFCILKHFSDDLVKPALDWWSGIIMIDQDLKHTMGNFWGGPSHFIKLLLKYTNKFWEINKNYKNKRVGFFSEHPEEVILIKFIDFYRIKEKRITCSLDFNSPAFLTSITINGDIEKQIHNFKLIHDTKVNIEWSNRLFLLSEKNSYI